MSSFSEQRSSFDSPTPAVGFSSFLTPKLIRVAYPLGVFAIFVIVLVGIVGDFGELPGHSIGYKFSIKSGQAWFTMFYWIGFLVGSNLTWRIACETSVVFFRIYDILAKHGAKLESQSNSE